MEEVFSEKNLSDEITVLEILTINLSDWNMLQAVHILSLGTASWTANFNIFQAFFPISAISNQDVDFGENFGN